MLFIDITIFLHLLVSCLHNSTKIFKKGDFPDVFYEESNEKTLFYLFKDF